MIQELQEIQRETIYKQVDSIWKKMCVVKYWVFACSILGAILGSAITSVVGFAHECQRSAQEDRLLVKVDALATQLNSSVANNFEQHERENILLRELEVSQIKCGNLMEMNVILKSHFTGNANFLDDSRIINIYRDDIFEFTNWKNPDVVVRKFCDDNKSELVEWVRGQPNWESCLNFETVNMVNNYNENNVLHVAMKNIHSRTPEERKLLRLEYENWVKNK